MNKHFLSNRTEDTIHRPPGGDRRSLASLCGEACLFLLSRTSCMVFIDQVPRHTTVIDPLDIFFIYVFCCARLCSISTPPRRRSFKTHKKKLSMSLMSRRYCAFACRHIGLHDSSRHIRQTRTKVHLFLFLPAEPLVLDSPFARQIKDVPYDDGRFFPQPCDGRLGSKS